MRAPSASSSVGSIPLPMKLSPKSRVRWCWPFEKIILCILCSSARKGSYELGALFFVLEKSTSC